MITVSQIYSPNEAGSILTESARQMDVDSTVMSNGQKRKVKQDNNGCVPENETQSAPATAKNMVNKADTVCAYRRYFYETWEQQ